jgi:protein-tyrosine-phosphatase
MGLETKASTQYQVLFVCSGNICRSPLAETLFKSMAQDEGILASFVVAREFIYAHF